MNKKEIIFPFLAIGLALVFMLVSFAVIMSNGKSKKWVARKMKIGAFLLTLTAVSCNGADGGGEEITCYKIAETNVIRISSTLQNDIEVKLDTGNTIIGTISSIEGNNFSFNINDSAGSKLQRGLLLINKDCTEYSKDFKIVLSKNIKPGKYNLQLFDKALEKQDSVDPKRSYNLIIKYE